MKINNRERIIIIIILNKINRRGREIRREWKIEEIYILRGGLKINNKEIKKLLLLVLFWIKFLGNVGKLEESREEDLLIEKW